MQQRVDLLHEVDEFVGASEAILMGLNMVVDRFQLPEAPELAIGS